MEMGMEHGGMSGMEKLHESNPEMKKAHEDMEKAHKDMAMDKAHKDVSGIEMAHGDGCCEWPFYALG
jgi:hypothetical protein